MARLDGPTTDSVDFFKYTRKNVTYTSSEINYYNTGLRAGAKAFGVKSAYSFKGQPLPETATREFNI